MNTPNCKVASYCFSAACVGLIVLRLIWPALPIDATIVALLILCFVGLLLPPLIPSIKKLKIGDFEIERELAEFKKEVREVRESVPMTSRIRADIPQIAAAILQQATSDPAAALLSLCAELEIQVRAALGPDEGEFLSLEQGIEKGIERGMFSRQCLTAFRRWWSIKEHLREGIFSASRHAILATVSYGIDLLQLVTANEGSTENSVDTKPNSNNEMHRLNR